MTEKEEEVFWSNHFVCAMCGNVIENKNYSHDNGEGGVCKFCSQKNVPYVVEKQN